MTVGELFEKGLVSDRHVVEIKKDLDKERPTTRTGHWYEGQIRQCRNMEVAYFEWDEDGITIIVRN